MDTAESSVGRSALTMLTVEERSPWRWSAAATGLVIVAAHVPVTPMHLSEAPYIGWSFVALELAMAMLAAALLLRDTPLVWAAAGVVPVLAIAAYALTRSVAMPQIADDVGNWTEPLGVVSVLAEALLVVLVVGRHSWRRSWLAKRPLGFAVILLTVGIVATGCAASAGVG